MYAPAGVTAAAPAMPSFLTTSAPSTTACGTQPLLTLWPAVYDEVSVTLFIGGVASIVACSIVILIYALIPRIRRTPGWFVVRAVLCELVVSICFVILYFLGDSTEAFHFKGSAYSYLLVLLISLTAFEVMAHAWRLLMYFDLATIYRNPFHPNRHRCARAAIAPEPAATPRAALTRPTSVRRRATQELVPVLRHLACTHHVIRCRRARARQGLVANPGLGQRGGAAAARVRLRLRADLHLRLRRRRAVHGRQVPRDARAARRHRRRRVDHLPRAAARDAPLLGLPVSARDAAVRRGGPHALPRAQLLRGGAQRPAPAPPRRPVAAVHHRRSPPASRCCRRSRCRCGTSSPSSSRRGPSSRWWAGW